ncbi:ketoacyl-ACP synthase III family protein [Nocardia abscessus]|uniref:ketoacyl-ACP synthase III family protein n=1 Tax=Nocardia abscessus TaxID=120957 RepID=UPI00245874F7|nr:ketoacyl-ACP synthase III family protein [Nocardia abscessus]
MTRFADHISKGDLVHFGSDIWIQGVAAWFPPRRETASQAIGDGRLDPENSALIGVSAVPVAEHISAPDMAVNAARMALDRAECKSDEIDYLVHTWLYHQGHDLWSPPHYIANQLGATNCLPTSVHQGCDGGALAIQQAALRLTAVSDAETALVTAADRFIAPGIDRWNCQPALALGDAGTALVLTTSSERPAPFRLEALGTRTTVAFEVMNRGSIPFSTHPLGSGMPADFRTVTDEAIDALGADFVFETARSQVRDLLVRTIEEAGISLGSNELQLVAMPRVGTNTLEAIYTPVFEGLGIASTIRNDQYTGHLGCGDWGADLNYLYEQEILKPGRCAALIGAGGGFTWMCAIVRAFNS